MMVTPGDHRIPQVKRGRSETRPHSPNGVQDGDPSSQLAVRRQVGDGAVEMAVSIRGHDAHAQWALQEVAPQRILALEQTVMRLESDLAGMRILVDTNAAWATREQQQYAQVQEYATYRINMMAQETIIWRDAEHFARAVLYDRDQELQEELASQMAEVQAVVCRSQEQVEQLKMINANCTAEMDAYQRQIHALQSAPNLQPRVAELRAQLLVVEQQA